MTALLRSELLKLRTTRTALGLLLGMAALVLLAVLVEGLATRAGDLDQRSLLSSGTVSSLFAALVGIMAVTAEFRHGTVRSTFLVTPARVRVLLAKLAASLLGGLGLAIVAETLAVGCTLIVLSARGIDLVPTVGNVTVLVVEALIAAALWGGFGLGVGAIVRSQVGAIVGLLLWILLAENLIGLIPHVRPYLPGAAGSALSGDSSSELLSPAWGGLLLGGYVVVLAAAGAVVTRRRDVG